MTDIAAAFAALTADVPAAIDASCKPDPPGECSECGGWGWVWLFRLDCGFYVQMCRRCRP